MLNICEICWILNNKHTDHGHGSPDQSVETALCPFYSNWNTSRLETRCFQHWRVINILKWPLWFYAVRTFVPADCSRAGPAVWMDLPQRHRCSFLSCCCPAWVTLWYHTSFLCLWDFVWIKVGCWTRLSVRPCLWLTWEMCNQLFRDKSAELLLTIIQ